MGGDGGVAREDGRECGVDVEPSLKQCFARWRGWTEVENSTGSGWTEIGNAR